MPDELRPATWRDVIAAEAKKARVPPELAFAMVDQESGGKGDARSKKGAQGFFQLMPETAKELGVDSTDPVQNIRGGLTYFRQQLDRHNGDVRLALASYNAGPGAVAKAGGVPDYPETTDYVTRILGRLQGTPGAKPSLGRVKVGQPPPAAQTQEEEAAAGLRRPSGRVTPGAIPPPPAGPDTGWTGWAIEKGGEALSAVDPRTSEGRRNIAGGLGAAAATTALVATAPVSVPVTGLAALTAGVLGAGSAGLFEELGEQVVGTAPPSTSAALGAGAQQGAYEIAGQAFMWPIKAIGRRMAALPISQAAHEGLKRARVSMKAQLKNALDAASQAAGDVKELTSETVRFAGRRAAEALRGAEGAATEATVIAGQRGAAGAAQAAEPYRALVAKPPSAAVAGRRASRVIAGPATEARDLVGQQVDAAAKDGPDVDITALKAEAQQILDRIAKPQRAFPRGTPEEAVLPPGLPGGTAENVAHLEQQAAGGVGGDAKQARAILAARQTVLADLEAAQELAHQETLKHPALGVIQRVLNADDTVPFYDAHLWKSELQNALAGTYDKTVKTQVTSITQKLTGDLRKALGGHAPYDTATAAYKKIVPLYTKEYAAQLRKEALTDPESLIRAIDPGKPTAARMLRDVLVTQSAVVGKGAQGQRAWDLVRSAWTHENVLKGGIEKLDANLASLPQEFSSVFYGDQSGSQILQNLRQIASGYKAAVESGTAGVAASKTAGQASVETTRLVGERTVDVARREARGVRRQAGRDIKAAQGAIQATHEPTVEELRFAHSSLASKQPSLDELAAHGVRAFVLGPGQIWGGLSWLKLLRGPAEKDLIEWAAYSPAHTQRLIKLMTGPSPTGMAIADLLRASGILNASDRPSSKAGTRPPGEVTLTISGRPSAQVGAPPPR